MDQYQVHDSHKMLFTVLFSSISFKLSQIVKGCADALRVIGSGSLVTPLTSCYPFCTCLLAKLCFKLVIFDLLAVAFSQVRHQWKEPWGDTLSTATSLRINEKNGRIYSHVVGMHVNFLHSENGWHRIAVQWEIRIFAMEWFQGNSLFWLSLRIEYVTLISGQTVAPEVRCSNRQILRQTNSTTVTLAVMRTEG